MRWRELPSISFYSSAGVFKHAQAVRRKRSALTPLKPVLFRSNNPQGSEGERRYLAKVPMQRLGHPSEIAASIAFLASNAAAFITGQTLFVDGGASLGTL